MKEQNYSFNQDIIDALKSGKTVWARPHNMPVWFEMTEEMQKHHTMIAIYKHDWSLSKPKTKVKKIINRWANVYTDYIIGLWEEPKPKKRLAKALFKSKFHYYESNSYYASEEDASIGSGDVLIKWPHGEFIEVDDE